MRVTSNFVKLILNGIWKITGREPALCPECNRLMQSHGRCRRHVHLPDGRTQLSLRVFFCDTCRRYHRELPDFLIPHKYHCAETVAATYDSDMAELDCDADDSTIRRLKQWVVDFLKVCSEVLKESVHHLPFVKDSVDSSNATPILPTLQFLVQLLVNSGSWKVVH